MSLEECKRLAEKKQEKDKEIQKEMHRSRGIVDGEDVRLVFSINPVHFPGFGIRDRWVVTVSAYGELSSKYFHQGRRESAERYFRKLTQDYGLQEEET